MYLPNMYKKLLKNKSNDEELLIFINSIETIKKHLWKSELL